MSFAPVYSLGENMEKFLNLLLFFFCRFLSF